MEIVLLGGGHSHVEVIRRFGRRPEPGCRVTVVAREPNTPYSGMLPGVVAGHYRPEDCHIDLPRLCEAASVRFVRGEAFGIDRTTKTVLLRGAHPLRYGILSIDVGITPLLDEMEGAATEALVVKPLSAFLSKWDDLLARCRLPDGPRRIAAVGGGPAGFELILAVKYRLAIEARRLGIGGSEFSYALVTDGRLLDDQNPRVRKAARRTLDDGAVRLLEGAQVQAIDKRGLALAGGERLEADAVLVSTGATAPVWLGGTGLELDRSGFLATTRTLQCRNDPDIFAAGDCATIVDDPRPKAGVFAVRQGPVLAGNLRRHVQGRPLAVHHPQQRWLSILTTGGRSAIAGRGPYKLEGRWVWHWKDRIDRRWIRRYDVPAGR